MSNLPINELRIAQYRGLQDLELKDCGRVNLLVGENNSGKTTVLDALSLFCRPLDIANWREVAWRREIKSARTPLTEPFKWLFPQFMESTLPSPHRIWIEGGGCYPGRKLVAHYSEFESFGETEVRDAEDATVNEGGEPESGLNIHVLADYAQEIMGHIDEQTHLQNSVEFKVIDNQRFTYSTKVAPPSIDVGFISPVTHRTSQDTTFYLSQALRKERAEDDIREAVTRIMREIDPGVQKFEIVDTGRTTSTIIIKHKDTGMTPISAFGDGVRRALLIAAMIPAVSGGVLLIDEIETALHVSVLDSVLRVLRTAADRYNVQVFATTHSLEAVDAVAKVYGGDLANLVAHRLERKVHKTQITRYAGEMIHRLRFDRGLELR